MIWTLLREAMSVSALVVLPDDEMAQHGFVDPQRPLHFPVGFTGVGRVLGKM